MTASTATASTATASPASGPAGPIMLVHGRIQLALHPLHVVDHGWPLLLLHGLGERSPVSVGLDIAGWHGSIYALDFTGHGASTWSVGGGYTAETLMADVDAALTHLGPCTVLGRGLGGYVALLIAGARPSLVRGAVIDDGIGLAGGAATPGTNHIAFPRRGDPVDGTDPYALVELSSDVRPRDYATAHVRAAMAGTEHSLAIAVVTKSRPPWVTAICEEFGVEALPLTDALAAFAGRTSA